MANTVQPYRRFILHPTVTTTYDLEDYFRAVPGAAGTDIVNSVDDYQVAIEGSNGHAFCTAKSTLDFTITVAVQSPVEILTVYFDVHVTVDPPPLV